jgi:proline iminopeptidase
MKTNILLLIPFICLLLACNEKTNTPTTEIETESSYFDYSNSKDQKTGGIKMIPIQTAKGTFNVWTKRMGNN